ncbi:MAG: hypothetical protein Q8P32_02000 [Candidatus Komeilibacteria bacterium]|nr:hypothetical protein [Candidatus Komeilibacteria bacterium]
MQITIDLSPLYEIADLTPLGLIWYFFSTVGWIFLLVISLSVFSWWWLYERRKKYLEGIEQILLAIDIPKDNEQSLIAVEQIFASLHAIKSGPTLWDKYWHGKTQLSYSLEIISLEGYIQFLIRTPGQFKDLVESAIYAQYPEAEITEVNDYVDLIPDGIQEIDSDHKLWGTELTLAKSSAYPIKTYKSFEHQLAQLFIDPMASLLEVMSKIGPGEQIGLQLIIAPSSDSWKHKGEAIVAELIGAKANVKKHAGDKLVDAALSGLEKFSEAIYSMWGDIKTKDDNASPSQYQFLTTGQKQDVEQIENKLAQLCFGTTFRIYYLAKKEIFTKGRGVNAVLGAINQFNTYNLNAFKKFKRLTTDRDYFFVQQRVAHITKKLIKLYKKRSRKGSHEFQLCTEELATLYHFPTINVKAPLLKKAEIKTAEPPVSLPTESDLGENFFQPVASEQALPTTDQTIESVEAESIFSPAIEPALKTPAKPFVINQSVENYDFDNDYFERHFAKNKDQVIAPPELKPLDKVEKEIEPPANLPFA